MISTSPNKRRPLPRVVFKHQLATYFSVTTRYLWQKLLTDELFAEWGYDRDEFARAKRFPPGLTKCIYLHFGIIDLEADLSEELRAQLETTAGHQAPKDE